MARPDKAAAIAELKGHFESAGAAVLTEYRGLTVKNLKQLRRALGEDAVFAVTKNTLTEIAAREAGVEGLGEQLKGPTAIAFITGDVATVAKSLRDFAKANPLLVIKGGVLEGKVLDADSVKQLAELESREVLLAKLAGALQANLSRAVYLIAAPLSQAARALGALADAAKENPSLLGGAGVAAAPEADQEPAEATSAPVAAAAADTTEDAADTATTD